MKTSSRKIEDLHPQFQPMVRELLEKGNDALSDGWLFFITDGYRSMEDQQRMYNQGRTAEGTVITQAKPGQSPHNYGSAVDLAFQKNGKLSYNSSLYEIIYPIAKRLGFELGAEWSKFQDRPHFQHPKWKELADGKVEDGTDENYTIIENKMTIEVSHPDGVNVRTLPNTRSNVVTAFSKGTKVPVIGWVVGQNISGLNKWYVTTDNNFFWAGATTVVPNDFQAPSTEPISDRSNDQLLIELQNKNTELINAIRENSKLKTTISKQSIDIENKQSRIRGMEDELKQIVTIKNTNSSLSNQMEAWKDKYDQAKSKLDTAYAQAFENWTLIEIQRGFKGFLAIPKLALQIIGLMFYTAKNGYVIGWKKGARLYKVEDNKPLNEA